MTQAEKWAKDYIVRFSQMVEKLKENKFVESVRFWTFEPLSDQRINEIESSLGYTIDEHLKAFFKETNGLHLAWYSKIANGDFYNYEEKHNAEPGKWYVGFDETESCEGYSAILPLDGIIDSKLRLYDEPINPYYKRKDDVSGSKLHYLDKFMSYSDVCIYLNGRSKFGVVFGGDHGSEYSLKDDYTFVQYMEGILKNYCALDGRMYKKPLTINEIIKDHYENESAAQFLEKERFEEMGKETVIELETELNIDIRKKYKVFLDKELKKQLKEIETYTSFKEEETYLMRHILAIDKKVSYWGREESYSITFDNIKKPLDFKYLLPLEEKFAIEEGYSFPLIWLKNLPANMNFDSLEKAGLHTLYLEFSDKELDFSSLENKNFDSIETLWINDFKNCKNFDFLKSFSNLQSLRIAGFKNCEIPKDFSFLTKLDDIMIWSNSSNPTIPELKFSDALRYLTFQMDALTETPLVHAPNLISLKVTSGNLTTVSNITHFPKLQFLMVKGGITNYDELVNLREGVRVLVEEKQFFTGDKKTDLKRKFSLKHLDLDFL